jgi:DNA-binding NarL/FixJ family response regulator
VENPVANPTVVVADDHGLLLTQVVALLRRNFDVIGTAFNGSDLVADAARLRPDVIVLDISMPILNGIEAAHELRGKGSAAKLVFLTAHIQPEFADACFAEGALGYVTKSSLRADLVAAVNDALAGRRFISPTVVRQSTVR